MRLYSAWVKEIQLERQDWRSAWIACPPGAVPAPGQYIQAVDPTAWEAPLGFPLFPVDYGEGGFLAAAPVPSEWHPGTALRLRGPLGKGFQLPQTARRVALGGLGDGLERLLPLVHAAEEQGADVALFTDLAIPRLPPSVEVHPLSALPEASGWADWLAMDLPLEGLPDLRTHLGKFPRGISPCPAQVLIQTAMPCCGIGACAACALPHRRGLKLVCKDGPVFDLDQVAW